MNVMINKNEKLKVICIGSPLLQLIKPNCGISERSDKLARSLQIVFGKRFFLRFEKSQFFEIFSSYMLLYLTKIYTEIHEGTRRLPAPVRLMLFVIIFFCVLRCRIRFILIFLFSLIVQLSQSRMVRLV